MEKRLIDVNHCLFVLTYEDAQLAAKDLIGRELTDKELRDVRKGIERGLEDWPEVMRSAVLNSTGASKIRI